MQHWILSQNVKVMNLAQLFAESDFVDWKTLRYAKFSVGDIVYIYATLPVGRIIYKTRVVQTDIPFSESLDQERFFYDKEQYLSGKRTGSYFRLERLATAPCESAAQLNTAALRSHGVKSLQSPQKISGELLEHIESQFNPSLQNDEEEQNETPYVVTRIVLSKAESLRQQRARINKRLAKFYDGVSKNFMKDKLSVIMPDKTVISDYANYSTLIKVLEHVGFANVAELNLSYGNLPIITKEPKGTRYVHANGPWHVLKNWPTATVAQYINNIADALNLDIECDVVPK